MPKKKDEIMNRNKNEKPPFPLFLKELGAFFLVGVFG